MSCILHKGYCKGQMRVCRYCRTPFLFHSKGQGMGTYCSPRHFKFDLNNRIVIGEKLKKERKQFTRDEIFLDRLEEKRMKFRV